MCRGLCVDIRGQLRESASVLWVPQSWWQVPSHTNHLAICKIIFILTVCMDGDMYDVYGDWGGGAGAMALGWRLENGLVEHSLLPSLHGF